MTAIQVALLSPVGTDQRLTVSNSAVALSAITDDASHVFVDFQSAAVMVTFDGSTPTSTNGHRYASGSSATWSKATATAARFIREGSTDGVVHCTPLRY